MNKQKTEKFYLLCDSGDFYVWLLKHKNNPHKRYYDLSRSINIKTSNKEIELIFIHKHSNFELYNQFTKKTLEKTAGTPDYILYDENHEERLIIEDSNTAPVGNALLQRLDKLFPLMADPDILCPIKYIQYEEGFDVSNNKLRNSKQSWFVKSFASKRDDLFIFLKNEQNIYEKVYDLIVEHMLNKKQKIAIQTSELECLHFGIVKNIRSYKNNIFYGKLFKPNGTDAHPVLSTLLLISEVANLLNKEPIKIKCSAEHKQKFMKSDSKRIKKIIKNGVQFS